MMKILYIEDNLVDADLTQIELKKHTGKFELTHVQSIQEALDLFFKSEQPDFDLILTDMNLTDGNGLTLLAQIRNMRLPIAVVLVTGQGDEDTAVAALKAGADDYIIKHKNYLKNLPQTLENAYAQFKKTKTRVAQPIKVLYGEHNAVDVELTLRHIRAHSPHIQVDVVKDAKSMINALDTATDETKYDVLLIDFHLPGADIQTLLQRIIDDPLYMYPVVLITGHGNEETAVNVLKLGVTDYLVKTDGYLYRLPSVLENAKNLYSLFQEKEALAKSEARFRLLAENAQDVIIRLKFEPQLYFDYISPALLAVTGYSTEEIYTNPRLLFLAAEEKIPSVDYFVQWIKSSENSQLIFPFIRKDGHRIMLEMRGRVTLDETGEPLQFDTIVRDITERIEIETKLQNRMQRLNSLHTIDTAINSSFDLGFTYVILLEQVVTVAKNSAAAIIVFDPNPSIRSVAATTGFVTPEMFLNPQLLTDALPVKAALERRVVSVADAEISNNNFPLRVLFKNEGIKGYSAYPLTVKGVVKGVIELFRREEQELDQETGNFIETVSQAAAIAMESAQNFERLQRSNQELIQAYDDTLVGWINFLDLRDKETEGHTLRAQDITVQICSQFGFSSEELMHVRRGVLLHDIGKVGIPDAILNKPGALTDDEREVIKKHPVYAYQMLYPIGYLRPALDIPYCHHEKWDGTGYPRGLKGEDIPLTARIFAIVDVFDALTSDRPYRKAWTVEKTVAHIREGAGSHFDPAIVEKSLELLVKNFEQQAAIEKKKGQKPE
jgi:PAS domain S-box-containing protein